MKATREDQREAILEDNLGPFGRTSGDHSGGQAWGSGGQAGDKRRPLGRTSPGGQGPTGAIYLEWSPCGSPARPPKWPPLALRPHICLARNVASRSPYRYRFCWQDTKFARQSCPYFLMIQQTVRNAIASFNDALSCKAKPLREPSQGTELYHL